MNDSIIKGIVTVILSLTAAALKISWQILLIMFLLKELQIV